MATFASQLAGWAAALEPADDELELARRSLVDTTSVALAARSHPIAALAGELSEAGRWAALAHVLDFDDLHLPSTTHISAVCVPAALAAGGGARAYLAGAGVMSRIGVALGWAHYAAGWHATCTAGAPGAAVAAAVALGLDRERIATALALAIPAAGGVQRAFGTHAKSLQVGFAADAGVRAARLAGAGASAAPEALEQWLELVGGDRGAVALDAGGPAVPGGLAGPGGDAIPGGLAIKLYPCCYALQRPIGAVLSLPAAARAAERVSRVVVRAPAPTLTPLIHPRPTTGLEAKFSLQYGVAAAILDSPPGLASFTDDGLRRPGVAELMERVEVVAEPYAGDGIAGLLRSETSVEVTLDDGAVERTRLAVPAGAPGRAASSDDLRAKVADCTGALAADVLALRWQGAPALWRRKLAPDPAR
jgi:2-methylcitrate dehydratase PrpD